MPAMHELMFGTKLDEAVQHIVGQAVRTNTKEGYEKAVERLSGIRTFLIFIQSDTGREYTYALLALNNEISRLYRLADDPKIREAVSKIIVRKLGEAA